MNLTDLQRTIGNREVVQLLLQRRLASQHQTASGVVVQRVYTNTELKVGQDAPGEDPAAVAGLIVKWEDYAQRALAHLQSKKQEYTDTLGTVRYNFKKKQLKSSVKLAGVFKMKLESGTYNKDFLITRRDGDIGALMIRKRVGKQVFLDDLMANPRKLYQITPEDALKGQDDSASAAVEQVMREAVAVDGTVRLLGGDTSARAFWFKVGFGVMVPKQPFGTAFSRDENECVMVNPNEGTTERNMLMPKEQVLEYFGDPARFKDFLQLGPPAQLAGKLKSAVQAAQGLPPLLPSPSARQLPAVASPLEQKLVSLREGIRRKDDPKTLEGLIREAAGTWATMGNPDRDKMRGAVLVTLDEFCMKIQSRRPSQEALGDTFGFANLVPK